MASRQLAWILNLVLSAHGVRGKSRLHRVGVAFKGDLGERATEEATGVIRALPGVEQVRSVKRIGTALVDCESEEAQDRLIEALRHNPAVESASKDETSVRAFHTIGPPRQHPPVYPNDAGFGLQWSFDGPTRFHIHAPEGWGFLPRSRHGLTMGFLDTGVDYDHDDLRSSHWVNLHEIPGNGVDDDLNGYTDDYHGFDFSGEYAPLTHWESEWTQPRDYSGHGTMNAGIIAATANNSVGIAGVSWSGVRLMALKVLEHDEHYGSIFDLAEGLTYGVMMGAKIISCSAGSYQNDVILRRSVRHARHEGVLVVATAGNEDHNARDMHVEPAAMNIDNVLSVTGSDMYGELSSEGDYGRIVDVAAPACAMHSTHNWNRYKSSYDCPNSASAAHAAGLAAAIWMYRPNLNYHEVKRIIQESVNTGCSSSSWCARDHTRHGGIIDMGAALALANHVPPPAVPSERPDIIDWRDMDPHEGIFSGEVTFERAMDESHITHYAVLLVSRSRGEVLETLAQVHVEDLTGLDDDHEGPGLTSSDNHTRPGDNHTQPGDNHTQPGDNHTRPGDNHTRHGHNHTTHITTHSMPWVEADVVVVAGNEAGLQEPPLLGESSRVPLEDWIGTWFRSKVKYASFSKKDKDPRRGVIEGVLEIQRSTKETQFDFYDIFLSDSTHLPDEHHVRREDGHHRRYHLITSIPSIGYQLPTCLGNACDSIAINEIDGHGLQIENCFNFAANYDNDEDATITLSGPALLVIRRFQTEEFYDYLIINGEQYDGVYMPGTRVIIPGGPQTLRWHTDDDGRNYGFRISIYQADRIVRTNISTDVPEENMFPTLEVVARRSHDRTHREEYHSSRSEIVHIYDDAHHTHPHPYPGHAPEDNHEIEYTQATEHGFGSGKRGSDLPPPRGPAVASKGAKGNKVLTQWAKERRHLPGDGTRRLMMGQADASVANGVIWA